MGARQHYVEQFARQPALAGAEPGWLHRSREAALARFVELGFPTNREEDWRYTSVSMLERRPFEIGGEAEEEAGAAAAAGLALADSHLLVFIDGRFSPRLSRPGSLPDGAQLVPLSQVLAQQPEVVEACIAEDGERSGAFAALNAAFWADGAYLDLAPGTVVERPIQLLFVATRPEQASFPRNFIRCGAGARAVVIEHYAGTDERAYLVDAVTRIDLGNGAVLTHCKLQEEGLRAFHVGELRAEQGADSRLVSLSFAFGGQLGRSEIATRLDGEGAAAELAGLYLGDGRQHLDHHTRIDHLRPRCTSREFYKGVLDGSARAVFGARAVVHPGAQRTDAAQANHNLLLSPTAEVDTKPQLEIYADDVKCRHGATVGQLDPEQRFYLRSRGLDEATARAVLVHAFAREVLDRVDVPALRRRLEDRLLARLPGAIEELR